MTPLISAGGVLPRKMATLLRGARAKETSRYAIQYIQVAKNTVTATDGHQFVLLKAKDGIYVPPGLYWLVKSDLYLPIGDAGNFPNWPSIIPKHKKSIEIDMLGMGFWADGIQAACMKLDLTISLTRFAATFKAMGDLEGWNWQMYFGKPEQQVMFTNTVDEVKIQVVMMPFNRT